MRSSWGLARLDREGGRGRWWGRSGWWCRGRWGRRSIGSDAGSDDWKGQDSEEGGLFLVHGRQERVDDDERHEFFVERRNCLRLFDGERRWCVVVEWIDRHHVDYRRTGYP